MNSETNDKSHEGSRELKVAFIESSHVNATGVGAEGIEESDSRNMVVRFSNLLKFSMDHWSDNSQGKYPTF
jgi:hypothetical protein